MVSLKVRINDSLYLLSCIIIAWALFILPVSGSYNVTINSDSDTWRRWTNSLYDGVQYGENHGSDTFIETSGNGYTMSYIHFPIPSGVSISYMYFNAYQYQWCGGISCSGGINGGSPSGDRLAVVKSPWAEMVVNWSTYPSYGSSYVAIPAGNGQKSVNVSSLLTDKVNISNYGFFLYGDSSYNRYYSREHNDKQEYLILNISSDSDSDYLELLPNWTKEINGTVNTTSLSLFYHINKARYWYGVPYLLVTFRVFNDTTSNYDAPEYTLYNGYNPVNDSGIIDLWPYMMGSNPYHVNLTGMTVYLQARLVDTTIYSVYGSYEDYDYVHLKGGTNNTTLPIPTSTPIPLPTPVITVTGTVSPTTTVAPTAIATPAGAGAYNTTSNGNFSGGAGSMNSLNSSLQSVNKTAQKAVYAAIMPSVFSSIPAKVIAVGTYSILLLIISFVIKGKR